MKYIEFCEQPTETKTKRFSILSKTSGEYLGFIRWYAAWRQYVFYPAGQTLWSTGCLDDVRAFVGELNEKKVRNV